MRPNTPLLLTVAAVLLAMIVFGIAYAARNRRQPWLQQIGRYDPAHPETGDAMILDQLKQVGADLSRPREVIHYLFVPNPDAGERVAIELRAKGFSVEHRRAAETAEKSPYPWVVVAKTEVIVNEKSVQDAREFFQRVASLAGGDYDGWEAAAKP